MLRSRFGEPFRIEQEHLYRLRCLPALKSSSDVAGLRRRYDTLQSHVRGLKALKVPTTSYASMLTDVLLWSLPPDIVIEYHRRRANTELPFDTTQDEYATAADKRLQDLISFLQVEVESREKCQTMFDVKEKRFDGNVEQNRGGFRRPHPSTVAVFQNAENSPTKRTYYCFCRSTTHETEQCRSKMTKHEKR